MDGEFKYLEYITEDSNYYTKPKKREELEFSVENLDSTWVVNRNDSFWIMYFVPKVKMIEQGFKIHVSTAYENAANTLAIVSKLLIKKKESFVNYLNSIKKQKIIIIITHDEYVRKMCDSIISIGGCDTF